MPPTPRRSRSVTGSPAAGLVACGVAVVAGLAQAAAVRGVVRVDAVGNQLAAGPGAVVGDRGRALSTQDTHRVPAENSGPEAGAVVPAIAAGGCTTAVPIGCPTDAGKLIPLVRKASGANRGSGRAVSFNAGGRGTRQRSPPFRTGCSR